MPNLKRKTYRSSKGPKLFAFRHGEGRFKDIQAYKRAHNKDIKNEQVGH